MAGSSLDVEPRLLGRPSHFDGGEESWADWSVQLRAYLSTMDGDMAGIMDGSEALNRPIVVEEWNAEGVAASKRVYFILAKLLKGTALLILKQVEKGNGLECWRHLNMRYEGVTDNRLHVMLQGILRPTPFPQDARGFETSLSSWDGSFLRSDGRRWQSTR